MRLVGFNHDREIAAPTGEAWRYTKLVLPAEIRPATAGPAGHSDLALSGNTFALTAPAGIQRTEWRDAGGPYAHDEWAQLPLRENRLALRVQGDVHLSLDVSRQGDGATIGALQFHLDPGAHLTLWQECHGGAEGITAVTLQFLLAEGSQLDHAFRTRDDGSLVLTTETTLAARARSNAVAHVRGKGKTRLQLGAILAGADAEARLATLMQLEGQAHGDLHCVFRHDSADTRAHQLAKNLLDGEAKAIFTGRVHIARHAQRVDARQMNRNLLLSKKAWAVGQPQLEIFADDVKCGHGSSTGQIGDNETFYLLSRGIPAAKARALLTRAFVDEVFHEACPELRRRLEVT